ncbi:ABC transporter permease ['Camptotheca acuminata' phytoplasma]|uniref:ABC transporter permease n=1 Tax='Camptotheca acuminata' phytoplasma TaxID=3239192 RepID=UPI00351A97F3
MFKYFLKRCFFALLSFILVVFSCFVLVKMSITKPMQPPLMDDITWNNILEKEGYNKPIIKQFFQWSNNSLHGDFGFSLKRNQNVYDVVKNKIPLTIKMNLIPTLLSVPLGIFLAILSVNRKNSYLDHFISFFTIMIMTLGTLVIAILAQFFFVHIFNWFPYQVATPLEWQEKGFLFGVYSYLLPLLIMVVLNMVFYIRRIKAELIEQTNKDYFLLARSKGLSFGQTINRHALKNSLVPYAPVLLAEITGLITGSFLIEKIFSVDGSGRLLLEGFNSQDQPLLMLVFVFYTLVSLISSIIGDLSYRLLDPRIKVGGKKNENV